MSNIRVVLLRWMPPFILTAFGLIAINLIWLIPTIQNIRTSASVLALEILDRLSADTRMYLEVGEQQLRLAAEELVSEPDRGARIFDHVLQENPGFERLALIDRSGNEFTWRDRNPNNAAGKINHGKDAYFYLALEGASSFGDTFLGPSQDPYTVIAVPVVSDGTVVAVLVAHLNLQPVVLVLRSVKSERESAYIVDRTGKRILHSDPAELAKQPDVSARSIVQKVITDGRIANGLEPQDAYLNEHGEQMFAVGVPVGAGHLGLFLEQPRSIALNGEGRAIVIALATLILGLLVVIFIIRSNIRLVQLNSRFRELLEETDRVGKMLVRRDLELSQANARLEDLDVIKSEFVSVAAHQLRTPMTGIKWSLASLLEDAGALKADQRRAVREAFNATNHLTELINDLLDVARLEEGRMGVALKLQDFLPVVKRTFEQFKRIADAKGIEFFLDLPPGLQEVVLLCDEEKIAMVLDNLIDNAIKYTSPGGRIYVTLLKEGSDITVSVKDSGIGIPKSQQDQVFSKFFRSDNAQLYQTSGTGLGLYVSKNIVLQHKGKIWFESVEEGGSTFYFSLPLLSENVAIPSAPAISDPTGKSIT